MLRDWKKETEKRVQWIKELLKDSGTKGIIYGNSGGKDCTLVSILCKMATDNLLGVIMPCGSSRNFHTDKDDALMVAKKYDIKTIECDLTDVKKLFFNNLVNISKDMDISNIACANMNPRLRMITLYTIGQSLGYLVAGTGNLSELTMGYFTKWGDGACDFNPIADLTVTEIFEYLEYLGVPKGIIQKQPSAGLWEGQTDELEMGISYNEIDNYILFGNASEKIKNKIDNTFNNTEHKRSMPKFYK